MNDLSPTTRALLDAARGGLAPDPSAVARMRSGVATKVAGSAAASALAIKIGLACIVAAVGVTAAVHSTRSSPTHVAATAPVTIAAPTPSAPAAPIKPSAPSTGVELSREVALIDSATASLANGSPLAAIDTLKQYATETRGTGQLAEEAAAIEVEATCTAMLPDAATKLAQFDTHYPHSSQRARLTTACK